MADETGAGAPKKGNSAAITFRSIGHFFATFFEKAEGILVGLQGTATTVETVTAAVPVYGPLALSVEKTAYAVLGDVAAVVNTAEAAGKAKLTDAGLDVAVVATVEALVEALPQVAAMAKAL